MINVPSNQVHQLLFALSSKHGYSLAAREPVIFEPLVSRGPRAFSEAVLRAEGLDPELHEDRLRSVLSVVDEYFKRWQAADQGGSA
jgi:hypothetical protein